MIRRSGRIPGDAPALLELDYTATGGSQLGRPMARVRLVATAAALVVRLDRRLRGFADGWSKRRGHEHQWRHNLSRANVSLGTDWAPQWPDLAMRMRGLEPP